MNKSMKWIPLCLGLVLSLGVPGCAASTGTVDDGGTGRDGSNGEGGAGDPGDDPEGVGILALFHASTIGAWTEQQVRDFLQSSDCRPIVEVGNAVERSGSCVSSMGERWSGRTRATTDVATQTVTIRYDNATRVTPDQTYDGGVRSGQTTVRNGTLTMVRSDPAHMTFSIQLSETNQPSVGSASVSQFQYNGSGVYSGANSTGNVRTERGTWNGSGYVRYGTLAEGEIATLNEVRDEAACPREPLSGRSRIVTGGNVVHIEYDGQTSCDGESPWTLNGVSRSTRLIVSCSVHGGVGRNGTVGMLGMGALFTLATAWTRRRSARRSRPNT